MIRILNKYLNKYLHRNKYLHSHKTTTTPNFKRTEDVRRYFYKLYPKSGPKYFKHFRFVRIPHLNGGDTLEVYYKVSDESSFLITKGKNDIRTLDGRAIYMVLISPKYGDKVVQSRNLLTTNVGQTSK